MSKAEINHIRDLTPHGENARLRTARGSSLIEKSLQEVGAARSIVIDEEGMILAGNGTVEAAGQVGIERVKVVDVDGDTLVAVRRRGLTDEQKKRLAYFDNRTGELAEWDPEQIARDQLEGLDLSDMWRQDEIDRLVHGFEGEGVDPNAEWEGMPEFVHEDKGAYQSLIVHFKDQEAVHAFAEMVGQKVNPKTKSIWYPEAEIESVGDKSYDPEP
jgi:hypothetical protein